MADNVAITAGTGTTIAADDIAGVLVQRVKSTWGPDGTANDTDVATGKPLPIQVRSATGLIPFGEPTDAKATQTDTTSVTGISIWKQISASVQSLVTGTVNAAGSAIIGKVGIDQTTVGTTDSVSVATGQGAGATIGVTTGAAVITDVTGTVQQYLRGLVKRWVDALGAGTAAAALRTTLASDDPAVATLGAISGAAVITDVNGTVQQYLRGLVKQWIAGTLVIGAGSNLIGKTGIDQTTSGTTNLVAIISGQAGVVGGAGAVGATTQRMTLASDDPAVATLGVTTGAAVITDATGTIQQYLRGLVKRWVDALGAGTAAAALRTTLASDDPAVATLGATSGAKVITDANGTVQQYLRGLVSQWIAGTLTLASQGYSVAATFTPAATSHVANDCNGAAQTFTAIGPASARIVITSATLEIDGTAAEASAWRLYLYNVTPPSATADDGAWDIASGDRASWLGYIDLGTAVDLGSTQWIETHGINKQVLMPASGNLFGYLVNLTTLTPANVAHIVTLHSASV